MHLVIKAVTKGASREALPFWTIAIYEAGYSEGAKYIGLPREVAKALLRLTPGEGDILEVKKGGRIPDDTDH